MQLPEFVSQPKFWIKFIPIFILFVIIPIFFLDFTKSLNFGKKILFMIGGALGIILALNGKSLNPHKLKRR